LSTAADEGGNSESNGMKLSHPNAALLSVVMPVYNGAPYLAEAVQSILVQTYQDFELILVDDGSTDASAAMIHAFAEQDPRVRPLFLAHGGEAAALNAAVTVANGQWLALLKQDDVALPERLATQLAWLQESNIEIGGTCAQHFGDSGGVLWFPTAHQTICHELLFRVGMLDSTILLPTAIARENPWQTAMVMIDYEWLTRLVLRYRVGNLAAVLVKYRHHAAQTHIAQQERCAGDMHLCRRRYFFQLFPTASEEEYQILLRMVNKLPCTTLTQLAQSGEWLVRLLDAEDRFQQQKMGQRWLALCQRSAALGWGCYRLYRHYAAHFAAAEPGAARKLQLACALRLPPQHALYHTLRSVRHWSYASYGAF
jgi:glycosyltransferase involved in cell wall biosynthesis